MWCAEHMFGLGWGGWLLGGLMMLLFWGGLIALVFFTVRAFSSRDRHRGRSTGPEESSVDILKKRYARGELSKEEYETIRHDLET
jgi:putative membrane protein